jgi:hypothetical protein
MQLQIAIVSPEQRCRGRKGRDVASAVRRVNMPTSAISFGLHKLFIVSLPALAYSAHVQPMSEKVAQHQLKDSFVMQRAATAFKDHTFLAAAAAAARLRRDRLSFSR